MNLAVESETLATDQNMSWLASKHGTDATSNVDGLLDGAALLAIYTDGFAKAGTILAKNTSTGRYVPFDHAGSNGTNTAVGILYTTVKVTNRAGTAINTPFAMLRHGQVYTAKLAPYFFANRRSPRQRHLRPRLASDLPPRSA